jgi:hypothetical protein
METIGQPVASPPVHYNSTNTIGGTNNVMMMNNYPTNVTIEGQQGDRPNLTMNGNLETYSNRGLIVFRYVGGVLLTVGVVLFIVFGIQMSNAPKTNANDTHDTSTAASATKFIAPSVLLVLGVVFTLITKTTNVIFNKEKRSIEYSASRWPWFCFNQSSSFTFNDVIGVESRDSNVTVNKVRQSDIILKTRNGDFELGMEAMYGASAKVAGWKTYLREIGCPILR